MSNRYGKGKRYGRGNRLMGFAAVLLFASNNALSVEVLPTPEEEALPAEPVALMELANRADFIGVVQVLDTDYEYARQFPVGGTAFLRLLIPYKLDRPAPDIIEVYEEGLHPNECYFPNADAGEEGKRFLVFLRNNPDVEGQFLRLHEGCALQILVTENNGYALRYPPSGILLTDSFADLAQPMSFQDKFAVLAVDEIDVAERKAWVAEGALIKREDGQYQFTRGIRIAEIRERLGEQNLTRDRALLRPEPVIIEE